MDPPEVGPIWYPGLSGPMRSYEVKYRAARLRYVALCGVGAYGEVRYRTTTYPELLWSLLK